MLNIETSVNKMIEDILKSKVELSACALSEMRSSSLSDFCQIRFMLTWIECKKEEDSFTKGFFCDIGTTVHSLVQKWLGLKGYLYGLWKCPVCEKIAKEGFGPIRCCKGNLCVYEEYSLIWQEMTGHCDGLLLINNKFYILELKTISVRGFNERCKLENPIDYHYNQVNMYTLMGQKLELPYPIVGGVVLYVQRDNPSKYKAFPQKGIDLKKVQNTIKNYKLAKHMVFTGKFKNIIKKCKKYGDSPYCPYKGICFSKGLEEFITKTWELENKDD